MASLLLSALRLRVLLGLLAASGCGLKIDTGAGSGAMDAPATGTAEIQPSSAMAAKAAEAALSPGSLRGFAVQGSAAYSQAESSFLQCGFTEQWSVLFDGVAFERVQEQALSEECELAGCLFSLSGTGDLSARGRYGQAGTYPRELTITKLTRLERVTRAADLPALNQLSCPE